MPKKQIEALAAKPEFKAFGLLLLRVVLGIIFIYHGYSKLTDLTMTSGFFESLGIPMAGFFAVVVGLVEFLGGIALILGVFTTHAAFLLAIVMLVALLTTKLGGAFIDARLDLALFAALVAFMGTGPGAWVIGKKR
jgi:uncharacterized membrane protein YphA (DoxX/SURF4 family)